MFLFEWSAKAKPCVGQGGVTPSRMKKEEGGVEGSRDVISERDQSSDEKLAQGVTCAKICRENLWPD